MLPREAFKRDAERNIREFLKIVSKSLTPVCVILFGSYARGSYTESSDIDLCIISDELPENIFERRTIVTGVPKIRAIGFTKEEFHNMLNRLNPLVLDIVYHGKPILGEKLYRELKENLKKLIQKGVLKRYKDGWIFRLNKC